MALTLARTTHGPSLTPRSGGALRFVSTRITFDNSYPTGGETLDAATLGLASVVAVVPSGTNTVGNRLVVWDSATSKLKLYTAVGTEAANASDQSAIVVEVVALGY